VNATTENGFELTARPASFRRVVGDVWRSRDLVIMLAKKEFVGLYRRATLGMAWAVGLPLLQAIVLAIVFSQVARFKTVPHYPTFVYTGTLAWTFFSGTISSATTSIVEGQALATKIYFPRMVLPLAGVGSSLFSFIPGLPLLVVFAAVFHTGLGLRTLLLVPATLMMIALTTSFSIVVSALHVYFRDMKYVIQAIMLPWFWASAIFFPLNALGHGVLRKVVEVNPATGMILLFRAAIIGPEPNWTIPLLWSFIWMAALLVVGLSLYRRFDRVFVDLL
jgi:ABC-type polysaccharide/polyol phosphate export permease